MNQNIVYKIICLRNGRVYVGKTKNPGSRWSGHRSKLRAGKHPCKALQADWDSWGPPAFQFRCIDIEEPGEDMEAVVLGAVRNCCYNTNLKSLARVETLEAQDFPDEYHY